MALALAIQQNGNPAADFADVAPPVQARSTGRWVAVGLALPPPSPQLWESGAIGLYHALLRLPAGGRWLPGLIELAGLSFGRVLAGLVPMSAEWIEQRLVELEQEGLLVLDRAGGLIYAPELVPHGVPGNVNTVAAIARQWQRVKGSALAQRAARDLLLATAEVEPKRERGRLGKPQPDKTILQRVQEVFGLPVLSSLPEETQGSLQIPEPAREVPSLRVVDEGDMSKQIQLPLGGMERSDGEIQGSRGAVRSVGEHSRRRVIGSPLDAARIGGSAQGEQPIRRVPAGSHLQPPPDAQAGAREVSAPVLPGDSPAVPAAGARGPIAGLERAWRAAMERCPMLDGGHAITPTRLTYGQQAKLSQAWQDYSLTADDLLTLADYCNAGGYRKLSVVLFDVAAAVSDARQWAKNGRQPIGAKPRPAPSRFLSAAAPSPPPSSGKIVPRRFGDTRR